MQIGFSIRIASSGLAVRTRSRMLAWVSFGVAITSASKLSTLEEAVEVVDDAPAPDGAKAQRGLARGRVRVGDGGDDGPRDERDVAQMLAAHHAGP